MKTLSKILGILLLSLITGGFNSCEKKILVPETGTLELFFSTGDLAGGLKSVSPDSMDISPYHVLLSIVDPDSNYVMENEMLPLYKFGEGFFSEKIELKAGHLILLKFMIINPEGEVIFASPLAGSPKAYLVKAPLPLSFRVQAGETTRLTPEVLAVRDEQPSDFGYTSFGFSIVKPLPFFIGVMIDDPMIMAPVMYTEALLSVYHPDGWNYDFKLQSQINRVIIRGGAESYKFLIQKRGFESKKLEISAEKLLSTSPENPLLIRLGPGESVLVLQPGPDMGWDAMISDLNPEMNFGKHPYFEATYMSEPILTVIRENRSLIHFSPAGLPKAARIQKVILTLFFDVPLPWDSNYYFSPDASGIGFADPGGGILQQIVEPWQEHEVTWNNQPKTIEANQVRISPFVKNANFIDVDVTGFYIPVQEIAASFYGMMFKVAPEQSFPGFRFTSSDYMEPRMHPMLKIYYTIPLD